MFILSIVGARPQFIKAAAVSRAIAEHNKRSVDCRLVEKIVHTGQHYDENMSKVFFEELEIPRPNYNLGVGSSSHGEQTGKMLHKIEAVLMKEKPDWCLVYGDTNSTLAGALAAVKLDIPVVHIEAGLRSFNRKMPEEINRVLTDHISDLLFCPTDTAVKNLEAEGITRGVHQVGDVMYDSVMFYQEKAEARASSLMKRFGIKSGCYYLATIHRAENTNEIDALSNMFEAFAAISTPEYPTLLPLHPRTRKKLAEIGLRVYSCIRIIEPVSYLEMLALEKNASVILTDSGGVQKEAYWFKVPCVTLRDETEWIETVEFGWNLLAGVNRQKIVEAVKNSENRPSVHDVTVYGDGHAAEQISNIVFKSDRGQPESRSVARHAGS